MISIFSLVHTHYRNLYWEIWAYWYKLMIDRMEYEHIEMLHKLRKDELEIDVGLISYVRLQLIEETESETDT